MPRNLHLRLLDRIQNLIASKPYLALSIAGAIAGLVATIVGVIGIVEKQTYLALTVTGSVAGIIATIVGATAATVCVKDPHIQE